MTTHTYQVTGMTCSHCEQAVREEVSEVRGITDIEVSASAGRLTVTAIEAIDDVEVIAAVNEAGYEAVKTA